MKWHEMQNIFVGYNEEEDFRILICAFDKQEAYEIVREYAFDANLEGEWEISETTADSNNTHFDCDYIITGGQ